MPEQKLANKPVASKPVASKPVASKPVASKPVASKPVASKPVASKPVASKPVASKPVASKPVASKPEPTKSVAPQAAADKSVAATPKPRLNRLEETKAKNKMALADALAKAQAVKLAQPPSVAPAANSKAAKAKKSKRQKMVRHAISMPEIEYEQITTLKKRIASLGGNVKRSELVRAGLALLAVLNNVQLTTVMARIERIKTGRPAKK
jgi:hypothetical protein